MYFLTDMVMFGHLGNVEGQRGFIRKSNCVELQRVGAIG